MRRLLFCLEELTRHLREHRGVVALAVSTITVAFFVLGLFLLVWVNIREMTQAASEEARVQVFLREGLDQAQRDVVRGQLEREPAVESVVYVSEEEALSRFKTRLKDQASLLEGLGENPLPASFELRVRQDPAVLDQLAELAGRIRAWTGVATVRYGQEWIDRFRVFWSFVRALGVGIGGLVAIAVVAIVTNTIRFMIGARSIDITVLRIVGASPGVIALPYLLEGVMLGLISVGCAVGLLAGVVAQFGPTLEVVGGFLLGRGGLHFLPADLLLVLCGAGALLGGAGSIIALQRHFRLSTG
ncbi:MAG: ABC transporter permease [Nitrospirae bacterium]|nr:ABC transporter permease [Nitrospirota bacterium]